MDCIKKQAASLLDMDIVYYSHMENYDNHVRRAKLKSLAKFYQVNEKTLMPFWLAERVLSIVQKEDCATDALKIVLTEIDKK